MRLYEFDSSMPPEKLVALSQLIKGRAENTASSSGVTVDAFIKMARNMGITLDRETLTDLMSKPPLSNTISGIEGDTIKFHSNDDAEVETPNDQAQDEKRVEQMAKRQLGK